MLAKGFDLKADVLIIGYHGSTSSTSSEYLKAVSPKYAVIFVDEDNIYGHECYPCIQELTLYYY